MDNRSYNEETEQLEALKEAAKEYAKINQVSLKEAEKKLAANYKREEKEVDTKELALRAIKGMRLMLPKLNGLESREQGVCNRVESAVHKAQQVNGRVDMLFLRMEELEKNNKTFLQRLRWLFFGSK
jgi:hypothetical protein